MRHAFEQLVFALERGDGSPVIAGAEKFGGQTRQPHGGGPVAPSGRDFGRR